MLGVNPHKRICPICGGRTSFSVSLQKGVWHCFKCDNKGNAISLYAQVQGVDNKEAFKQIMNALNKGFKPDVKTTQADEGRTESDANLADIDTRDAVYSAMLSFGLDEAHQKEMASRGMKNAERYFATLDLQGWEQRSAYTKKLMEQGLHLRGVPGFYKNKYGWTIKATKRGILVPYRAFDGKVQGIQIRKDSNLLKTFEDGSVESKYTWLSSGWIPKSAEKDSGTRARAFVHYAVDFRTTYDGRKLPTFKNNTVYLTEGGMKAQIAHELSGHAYIAVPGVNALSDFAKELKKLHDIGVMRIINAYDMDYLTNPNVQEAVNKTKQIITDLGFEYNRLSWEDVRPDLKGIDDFLADYRSRVG